MGGIPQDDLTLEAIPEGSRSRYSGVVRDDQGVAIPTTSIDTFVLVSLYVEGTGTVINARTDIDVHNSNGGTVDASGNFVMLFTPADNDIEESTTGTEIHLALFKFTWDGNPDNVGYHRVRTKVVDLLKVA